MINIKELKIGNLIVHKGNVGEVTGILDDIVYFKRGATLKYSDSSENIDPLPIAGFRLKILNFEDFYNDGEWIKDGYLIKKGEEFGVWSISFKTSEIDIHYIHELQNIYSALEKKELELNFNNGRQ